MKDLFLRRPRETALAITVAISLALVACGGDAESSPTSGDNAVTTVDNSPAPTSASAGPSATVAQNLPLELVGSVGPIQVIGAALPLLTDPEADSALGALAPVIVGESFDGESVRIDAVANGPTLVVFLAHWCPHCNAEIPRINELRDSNRFPPGLNIVGISTAMTAERVNFPPAEWLDRLDWSYPAIPDGIDLERGAFIAAEAFGVKGFPFMTLIDGDGSVAVRWSGERDPDQIIDMITSGLSALNG